MSGLRRRSTDLIINKRTLPATALMCNKTYLGPAAD